MAHETRRPLGQVLVDQGLITPEQLDHALSVQRETEKQLGEVLVMLGFISPGVVANGLAEQHGGPLKTEYGISMGFGGERPAPRPEEARPEAPVPTLAPDALAPWRIAVEQRDALIQRFRDELLQRHDQAGAITGQLAEATSRIAELEARAVGTETGGESLRVVLAEREEQLAGALALGEEAATQRKALEARIQELENERERHAAVAEELKAAAVAQPEDVTALETASGRVTELEAVLEAVAAERGELRVRVAGLERSVNDRADLADRLAAVEAERAELEARLAEATVAPAPAPAERQYDESAHLLFVPTPDGYSLLSRKGRAPQPGDTVELDGSSRVFVVERIGPSPLGPSPLACAYLAEA